MRNRVERVDYNNDKLVLKEFIHGETVELKQGEVIVFGDLLIFDTASKKYVKYVPATHKATLSEALLRVYNEVEGLTAGSDDKVVVVRQGILDRNHFKAIDFTKTLSVDDYKLIAQLERLNIYLEEVK